MDEAIVEVGGGISAFAGCEGVPLALIMDGRPQPRNLARSGLDRAQLDALLAGRGLRAAQVYLALLDTQGRLSLQLKGGGALRVQAIDPGKVAW